MSEKYGYLLVNMLDMIKSYLTILVFIFVSMNVLAEQEHKMPPSNTIGICLSGGGALGFSHIGVLQALEDNGIKPAYISGSSMGAIIGVLYAQGISPKEMMKIIPKEKMNRFSRIWKLPSSILGFSSMITVHELLSKYVPHNRFDHLQIPLFVCVTNLYSGEWEIKSTGDRLIDYVCASAAIPSVFEAQIIDSMHYVDGGVLNNLPVEPLLDKCDVIIGVDVLEYPRKKELKKASDVVLYSILAANAETHRVRKPYCNYYISCNGASTYSIFDFHAFKELYEIGYQRTVEYIQDHPEMLLHR
ncbi:MAG TPA: patatin-like phospholipase family protein [Paludibacteraceae bacterium]|nr:patatin-like phospholipase family protein [Paludibacteraceae bacterium]